MQFERSRGILSGMQFPQTGQTFQAKYKLLDLLGRGGFAAVYRATDIEIGREVAIKILTPGEEGYDTSLVARFQREARVVAQLRDPHTITMFDYGRTDDGLLYMVFEYVAGADLAQRLATGPLPAHIATHVLEQLLYALREAHTAGVLHRDIKPANVLVFTYMDDEWKVKLLDFGIAKPGVGQHADPVATLTRAGGIIGTPRYMSPEQLCGESLTPATDIYSLGLVAYQMLVGSPAIDGRDTRDNIVQQLSETPLRFPPHVDVPAPLRHIIERMMARNADDRYQSAYEVLQALRATGHAAPHTGPRAPIDLSAHPPVHYTPDSVPRFDTSTSPSAATPMPPRQEKRDSHPAPANAPTGGQRVLQGLSPIVLLIAGVVIGGVVMILVTRITADAPADDSTMPVRITPGLIKTEAPHHGRGLLVERTAERDEGRPPAEPEPADLPTGCGDETVRGGTYVHNVTLGLSPRQFTTYVPTPYDPSTRHRVVLLLHDRTRSADRVLRDTALMPLADEHQLIIVAPSSSNMTFPWNPADDLDFITQALDMTRRSYCVAPEYVFAIGHNVAGGAVEGLACLMNFSAIATTAFRGPGILPCRYDPPIPHIHLVGEDDRYHPIEGGSSCDVMTVISLQDKEKLWRDQNGCVEPRVTTVKLDSGTCSTWTCDVPFVSCRIEGGRDWPNSAPRGFQFDSCKIAAGNFPIATTVWDFFASEGRPLPIPE